jgi:hypothetical protein
MGFECRFSGDGRAGNVVGEEKSEEIRCRRHRDRGRKRVSWGWKTWFFEERAQLEEGVTEDTPGELK